MKLKRRLKQVLALCLCLLCLASFALPAGAAKKEPTSFRHASVPVKLAYTQTVYSGKAKTPAGSVNVTTVSAFSPDAADDVFTLPDNYEKVDIIL